MKMNYQKEVMGVYDQKTIRVYQAYNKLIADEAVKLQNFGEHFSRTRMTWIKPSFLWMMHRSNWGKSKNQEMILAIDIRRSFFDDLLAQAVLTTFESAVYQNSQEWAKDFNEACVYCQWDPDKGVNGNPITRAAIQLGLKREALEKFLDCGIVKITDITPSVTKWREQRNNGKLSAKNLPLERIYPVTDKEVRRRLHMPIQ